MLRHPLNPLITRKDLPGDPSSVFNPGGIAFEGKYLLLLRVQDRGRHTHFYKSISSDGIHFETHPKDLPILHLERCPHRIYHIYDARITALDGRYHIVCAMDTDAGCFLGYFVSDDFERLDFCALVSDADVRNGVLFPEKVNGRYLRFERPNRHQMQDGVKTGAEIVCSSSQDLYKWNFEAAVMQGRAHFWDELIGSGPPPIKTKQGWLHFYHGVATHFGSANIYQTGVSLHDLELPWKTLGRTKYNVLEPRELYELVGQVPNVVFPTAAWVKDYDEQGFAKLQSPLYLYYGAADTCVAMAYSTIEEILGDIYEV